MNSGDLQTGLGIDAEGSHPHGRDGLRLRERSQVFAKSKDCLYNSTQSSSQGSGTSAGRLENDAKYQCLLSREIRFVSLTGLDPEWNDEPELFDELVVHESGSMVEHKITRKAEIS